ncbi:MAG: ligand-binding sensor domain-containing protein, partial [Bacteroidales bacterium]
MRFVFLLTICFVLLQESKLSARTKLNFREISLKEGLSHTAVRDIHRDSQGILWIATNSGLNRYDGNQMRQYLTVSNDTSSLPGNYIHFVQEDEANNLWIGTDKSLARYNRERDCFERYPEWKNLEFKSCYSLEDRVIFFEADRVVVYWCQQKTFETINYPTSIGKIPLLQKITRRNKECLLIGTRWQGIYQYNLTNASLEALHFHSSPRITAICVDNKGTIWLSSYAEGLFAYDADGHLLHHYTTENSDLCHNIILDIQQASNGDIWIASDGNGISILDKDLTFYHLSSLPNNPEFLPVNSISRIYEDNYQNIWIGTVRGGCLEAKLNAIDSYTQYSLHSKHGMSARTVTSFYEDKKGKIWIGTDGNGINRFDPVDETFLHYPTTFKKKITSIAQYSQYELLLSYFGEGLKIFNTQNGRLRDFSIGALEDNKEHQWISTNLKNINTEQILIMSDNLYLYSIPEGTLTSLNAWTTDSVEVALQFINSSDSLLYIYSPTKIFSVNVARKSISLITDINKHIGVSANSIVQDAAGDFWIASERGLWKYQPKNNTYIFEANNHFQRLTSLLLSSDSALWIGASNKIYCLQLNERHFLEYDASDGVHPNIYIPKATISASNGDLYFGGVNGFQRIATKKLEKDSITPSIEPIELWLNGKLFTGFSVETQRALKLPP